MVWKKSIFADLRSDMSKPPCKKLRKYLTYTQKKFGGHTIKIADSNFFSPPGVNVKEITERLP